MSGRNPCEKDCPKRSPTCHAKCKEYIDWQQNHLKEQERIRKLKETDAAFADMSMRWGNRR